MIGYRPTFWVAVGCLALCGLLALFVIDTNRTIHAVEHIQADRWTAGDMKRWTEELRAANPDLVIPEAVHLD